MFSIILDITEQKRVEKLFTSPLRATHGFEMVIRPRGTGVMLNFCAAHEEARAAPVVQRFRQRLRHRSHGASRRRAYICGEETGLLICSKASAVNRG